jgi:hypothetical protein
MGKVLVRSCPPKKHHRWALDFARRVVGMARPNLGRLFVAHRRIVGDEGADSRRRRDEVNAYATAHAVSDHADPRAFDVVARKAVTPASVDDANEIRVRRLVLNLGARVDVLLRRIAEHVIEIRNHRGVTELSEFVGRSFQVSREARMLMNEQKAGTFLRSLGVRDVTLGYHPFPLSSCG